MTVAAVRSGKPNYAGMPLKPVISTERRFNKRRDYRFGVFCNATEKNDI